MKPTKLGTLLISFSLLGTQAFAHEPGEQLIGSSFWKNIFFGAIILFIAALLNWIISKLPISQSIKGMLCRAIRGAIVGVAGYMVYHWFIE